MQQLGKALPTPDLVRLYARDDGVVLRGQIVGRIPFSKTAIR